MRWRNDAFDACAGALGTSVRGVRGSGARGGGQRELCNNTRGATFRMSVCYTVWHEDALMHLMHALAHLARVSELREAAVQEAEDRENSVTTLMEPRSD